MKVPLSAPVVDDEMRAAALRALESGRFILGPECEAFERELAAFAGTAEAVLVSSGTAAIELALEGLGLEPGSEVIVPALTAFPTVEAILRARLTPLFAESDAHFGLDARHAESLVSPRTGAILGVDLYGHPADWPALAALTERRGLVLLEDACQAHGARIAGRPCGSWGRAAFFSFYPSKNVTVAGDGGAVCTSDAGLAARVRALRDHGRRGRYEHEVLGRNARFNEIQAAIGRVQLRRLPAFVARRRQIAARYRRLLDGIAGLSLPVAAPGVEHAWHLFVVRCDARDALAAFLREREVSAETHYPIPAHRQPAVPQALRGASLPGAEAACREVLSLPIFPAMTDAQVDHVAACVRAFFHRI